MCCGTKITQMRPRWRDTNEQQNSTCCWQIVSLTSVTSTQITWGVDKTHKVKQIHSKKVCSRDSANILSALGGGGGLVDALITSDCTRTVSQQRLCGSRDLHTRASWLLRRKPFPFILCSRVSNRTTIPTTWARTSCMNYIEELAAEKTTRLSRKRRTK